MPWRPTNPRGSARRPSRASAFRSASGRAAECRGAPVLRETRLQLSFSTHLLLLDRIPPRTGARHQIVVALDHLHGLAQAVFGGLHAHLARLDALLLREPRAIVAPDARPISPL